MTRAFGIDVSHWNTVDWRVVGTEIDFAIAKSSEGEDYKDDKFPANCQGAYDAGIPFGAYHYFKAKYYTQFPFPKDGDYSRWPSPEKDLQFQNFVQALKFKAVHFICLDLENIGNTGVDGQWYSVAAQYLAGEMFNYAESRGIPFFIYTRNTFIKDFAPQINNWVHRYNSWAAQWTWNAGLVKLSWEDLPPFMPKDMQKPAYFSTRPTWELWQFSGDRFHLPGINGAVDLNVYNGTREQLYDFLKYSKPVQPPIPEPEPEPEPVTKIVTVATENGNRLRFRAAPSLTATVLEMLPDGTELIEVGREGDWVQVLREGWVHKDWVE